MAEKVFGDAGRRPSAVLRVLYAGIFNIGFGLVAVAFTIISTRCLSTSDAGHALVAWNVLTIIGAVTQQPAEIYAPRLTFEIRSMGGTGNDIRRATTRIVVAGTLAAWVVALVVWLAQGRFGTGFLSPLLLLSGFGVSYVHRARLIGRGEYGFLAATAIATGTAALMVAAIVITSVPLDSAEKALAAVSTAFVVPASIELLDRRDRLSGQIPRSRHAPPAHVRRIISSVGSLGATSAVSLLLLAGGAPVAALVGMEDLRLTSFAVAASVAAVPSIMFASAMLPILNHSVEAIERNDWGGVSSTLRNVMGFSAVLIPLLTLSGMTVGPFVLEAYIGTQIALTRTEVGAIFMAASIAAVSNVPRLVITALGEAPRFNKWLVGISLLYGLFILLCQPLPPFWRVTGATLISGSTLTALGIAAAARFTKQHQTFATRPKGTEA